MVLLLTYITYAANIIIIGRARTEVFSFLQSLILGDKAFKTLGDGEFFLFVKLFLK